MKRLILPLIAAALLSPLTAVMAQSVPPQVSIVFKTQDLVPGGGTNAHFSSFGNPAFNDYNHVAFQASVSEVVQFPYPIVYAAKTASNSTATNATNAVPVFPSYTNTWSGIWADNSSGARQLVVRTAPPFIADIGGFSWFSDPVYNNYNAVAFIANYNPGFIAILPGSTNFHGGIGVWTSHDLSTPVAFVGEPAPGYTNNASFKSFDQIALPDQGGVVMLATVTATNYIYPPKSTNPLTPLYIILQQVNQQGIWAQDTSGKLQLIARQGGVLNVRGTNKTIASLCFMNSTNPVSGQTRHFSQDTGNILFKATFNDGSQAGVKVIFP